MITRKLEMLISASIGKPCLDQLSFSKPGGRIVRGTKSHLKADDRKHGLRASHRIAMFRLIAVPVATSVMTCGYYWCIGENFGVSGTDCCILVPSDVGCVSSETRRAEIEQVDLEGRE
jgi:hypothetical protein